MKIETLKNAIESCNINFLIGSGLSRPYLITLGNIELFLEKIDQSEDIEPIEKSIIKATLYKKYFEEVMLKNLDSYEWEGDDEKNYQEVITNYKDFLQNVNTTLLYRYIPIHNKQINLFTTNIDLFFEKALEETQVEFNDGFKGRLNPTFSLSNFQKSYKKTSLHYKNTSEIPVFNLLKLHGSTNWKKEEEEIVLSSFDEFEEVKHALSEINPDLFLSITNESKLEKLVKAAKAKIGKLGEEELKTLEETLEKFFNAYDELQIVNPTKEKFKTTLLNTYYYELLRLFANEMEKENTLLFALGFSFADEHIREIIIRAVNSNPTLQLYIIAFDNNAKDDIEKALGFKENRILNGNVSVIDPATFYAINNEDDDVSTFDYFSFEFINSMVFKLIAKRVNPTLNIEK